MSNLKKSQRLKVYANFSGTYVANKKLTANVHTKWILTAKRHLTKTHNCIFCYFYHRNFFLNQSFKPTEFRCYIIRYRI